ncbi:MAG: glycoside hydrolase family 95 protein, partial [Akkermansiaceae bacterium]|nr:glycoside hydrolase family 95 protein [Akkermansiaceae bacterium]
MTRRSAFFFGLGVSLALAGSPGISAAPSPRPFTGAISAAETPAGDNLLWYESPASRWAEALPLGNGHIGAMVFGGITEERIQFNEHTIWTGVPRSYARAGAVEILPDLRRMLQEMR